MSNYQTGSEGLPLNIGCRFGNSSDDYPDPALPSGGDALEGVSVHEQTFPNAVEQLAYPIYLQRDGSEGDALTDWVEDGTGLTA